MIYEVWVEGFRFTPGEHGLAWLKGSYEAESFEDACIQAFGDNDFYESQHNRYWGCQLFDNEEDARKNFG